MEAATTMNQVTLKGILVGMILGDGYLDKIQGGGNSRIHINHSAKYQNYIKWKKDILDQITSTQLVPYKAEAQGKKYDMLSLRSKRHPIYRRLREEMYRLGHKTATSKIMKDLTWEGIVVWFCDDGYFDRHSAHIFTHNFSESENYLMREWLKKKFNLDCKVYRRRQYYYLRFTVDSSKKIKEWMIKLNCGMNYKIDSDELPRKGDDIV